MPPELKTALFVLVTGALFALCLWRLLSQSRRPAQSSGAKCLTYLAGIGGVFLGFLFVGSVTALLVNAFGVPEPASHISVLLPAGLASSLSVYCTHRWIEAMAQQAGKDVQLDIELDRQHKEAIERRRGQGFGR